ncbi:MAG: SRPBCC family protein [Proteobacteria bacterium]|nr:SRPBCC family protein [Pseudomonadota bacterium]
MFAEFMGAEFRRYEDREFQGKPSRVVVAERVYRTNPADLWNALTDRERIPRWFLPIEGELKLGARYQLQGNAGGTITRCDPPEALDLTWEFGGGMSWVNLRLTPEGDATRLTLEHIVHASDVDEHWAKFGPAAVGVGWDLAFLGLGKHIAEGATVDRETGFAWTMSDEGKAYMRESAAAWAEAHIAGGADPEEARGMAARTVQAYTGGDARL